MAEAAFPHRAEPYWGLRSPLLPVQAWLDLGQDLEAPNAEGEELAGALERDSLRIRQGLKALVERPEVREALFLASPDLDQALKHWEQDPQSEKGQRAERALIKYLGRMTHRCTPFGLFAGLGLGRPGERTQLDLGGVERHRRHGRLDMDYLWALGAHFNQDPQLRARLRYRPNETLFLSADRWRYVEGRASDKGRAYHLVSVEDSPYLRQVLEGARGGRELADLAAILVDDEIGQEDAEAFLLELIDAQVLISDLWPAVPGPEPLQGMADGLRAAGREDLGEVLGAVQERLHRLDEEPLGDCQPYRELADQLRLLPVKVDPARLFQVDLVQRPQQAGLGPEFYRKLQEGVALLHRIRPEGSDPFAAFKNAFLHRFEAREVPLLEALDEESGIGFLTPRSMGVEGAPLLEGLAIADPAGPSRVAWGLRQHHMLASLHRIWSTGAREWELTDEDLKALESPRKESLPETFAAQAILSATSAEAVDEGRFQLYLPYVVGAGAGTFLGRFAHGLPELATELTASLAKEEALHPDRLQAEVVHLPEGRVGNVLCRPVLRGWEIPFLGHSGAPEERQLPLSDLHVSVRDGRVCLRSASLDREVLPRLSNAHNYADGNLGLYSFLCLLQAQEGPAALRWSWETLEGVPFLPRVRRGAIVLSRAQWNLSPTQVKDLAKAREAGRAEAFRAIQRLRQDLGLPRRVLLVEADNELPLDLENALSVDCFLHLLKSRPVASLVEPFPEPELLPLRSPAGNHTSELIVPFLRDGAGRASGPLPAWKAPNVVRHFPPGSPWVYHKLYAGPAAVDRLLREEVPGLLEEALQSQGAELGFFLRYGDPDWHLRLRFHHPVAGDFARWVQPRYQEWMRRGLVWKVQADTYEREIERYGGAEGVLLSEALFHEDSRAALALIPLTGGDGGALPRAELCLLSMHRLLDDLGLDLEGRHRLLRGLREGFGQEFHADSFLDRQLGDAFRRRRSGLEALLRGETPREVHRLGTSILEARSEALAPIVGALKEAAAGGRLTESLEGLAESYLHMIANRLLRASHRAQELVLYDHLARLYESSLARQRKKSPASV